jgi:hypothetical protein
MAQRKLIPIKLKDPSAQNHGQSTWTVTFSESVENHVGMQQMGAIASNGYSLSEIKHFSNVCQSMGYVTEEVDLETNLPQELKSGDTGAMVLIIRNGLKMLVGDQKTACLDEIKETKNVVDKHAWMRGRVVNKIARYNLCYGDEPQKADYESKKGTIVAFTDAPRVNQVRSQLGVLFGEKCENMLAELNYYYDTTKCGIGFHGDGERRRVIGLRVGSSMNLHYQWFHQGKAVGNRVILMLNEGDLYIMSEKAVGTDWKKRKVPTLRHAAGASQYTTIKV